MTKNHCSLQDPQRSEFMTRDTHIYSDSQERVVGPVCHLVAIVRTVPALYEAFAKALFRYQRLISPGFSPPFSRVFQKARGAPAERHPLFSLYPPLSPLTVHLGEACVLQTIRFAPGHMRKAKGEEIVGALPEWGGAAGERLD